ncbi:MAG: Rne/Rng family ribonuclease [Chlamydiae bacterium]|nr:Rne/Rng family ribonuclease [Chlamydiota bacterium]MBI3276698.1 Rne/Rng family ribonuclease [Chlamydiota bacterium]
MSKEIIINSEGKERRIAFLEDGQLEDFSIERESDRRLVGSVYKGIIENVVPGIQAAFVNVGLEKNGFLHVSDIINPSDAYRDILDEEIDEEVKTPSEGEASPPPMERPQKKATIDELVKTGQEVVVQVIKDPIGTKGVRLSTNISLPGRYMVLLPDDPRRGISRRIMDKTERARLREILWSLNVPENVGIIIRTVGEGMHKKYFIRDLRYLLGLWKKIERRRQEYTAPNSLHTELDLALKTVRDAFTESVGRLVVDSRDDFRKIKRFVSAVLPRLRSKVELYSGIEPIFEHIGIEKEIKKIFDRKVWLKTGGYLIIEQTEALVAIDVNSGRNVGKNDLEETILETNMEAVEEVAKQMRLRNVGGIVIIDLIDMKTKRNQMKVLQKLRMCLRRDKAKTNILPISEIGLVEMTRQRVQESTNKALYESCPVCSGLGSIKSSTSIILEVLRELKSIVAKKKITSSKIILHPKVADKLLTEEKEIYVQMERSLKGKLEIEKDVELNLDDYKIVY